MNSTLPAQWMTRISRLPAEGGPTGSDWVRALPRLIEDALGRWGLQPAGAVWTGQTAVVVPVQRDGRPLALKVVWPHPEAFAEHLALRHWDGCGAVRLVAADPPTGTLLLERLDPECDLHTLPIDAACRVVGQLLAHLHVPAPPSIPPLSGFVDRHLVTVARLAADGSVPRRIAVRARALADDLLADAAAAADARIAGEGGDDGARRLLHTDLHFANVLAADRSPWLAIDPKPMAGHPGFEIQPLLRNRVDELGSGSTFRWSIRRRLDIVCDAAGIDVDSARYWSLVHTALQIGWAAAAGDQAAGSLHIAIFKALDG